MLAPVGLPPITASVLSPILSCHVKCCWFKSHFPCPVWSCLALNFQSTSAPHASCPRVCESTGPDCLLYCLFKCLMEYSHFSVVFKCPSTVCLSVVPVSAPEEQKLFATLFRPLWNAAWPSYAWQTSSVCWLLYKC